MGDIMKAIDALQMERQTQTPQMPKSMPANLAQTVYAGTFKVPVQANMPKTSFLTNVGMGFIDATDTFFNDTPEQIRLIGGQAQTALGGYFEEPEMIKRGQMNIATANRNLQANMEQRSLLTPESAQDTFGYALGAGASNYGTMVIGGVTGSTVAKGFGAGAKAAGKAAGAAALGTMGVMEVGGEAQERAEKHVADTKDESFTEYTPEKATKNLAAEGAYGAVSMLMEKYMGYGKQRQLFNLDLLKLKSPALRATASLTKTGLKSAVSEAGTEFAQSLANMGIDLIDDTMSWGQVPDRLKQELMGWAAAGVIGGTAGIGAGIYNRSRGIKVIKDNIQGTVPEEDLEKTAAAIFDSATTKVSDVVSVELELSSELQNKHGAVYDSMQRAIKRAADESGAFKDVSEEDLAQYVGDTAKLFADQVLAEAQMRNEPIDTVLKASDIVYEDGGIRLAPKKEDGKTRVLVDSSVNVEGEQLKGDVSQEAKVAVKNVGYADFRNFIDEESNPVSEEVFNKIKEAISARGNNISYVELMNKVGKELDADMNALSMSNEDFMEVFDYIAEPNMQALEQGVMLRQGQIADNGRNVELTINSQEEMQGLSDDDFKVKMLDTLKSFKGNKIFNQSLNGDIEIRTSSIKKYKSFFADKNKRLIVPYIPELLGKARFTSENTYTPETEKNIVAYWKADLPINIDDDTYNVHLTVKEDDKGNFFWDAQVNEEARRTVSATNPSVGGLTSEISEDVLSITPVPENVNNTNYQNKPQPKGLFDANRNLIKIFESADFSTLPHELAHYWLNNMWNYTRSGNASERYRQRWNVVANWLGITPEQTLITRRQQEKFARGYEQYLLNGNLPTPIIKGAFDDYDRWLKRVYGDMNNLNVRLSDDAVRFFQSMTTGTLPPPKIKPSKKPRSKMTLAEKLREKAGIKADDTQDDKARNFIKEEAKGFKMPENAEARTIITSNITEGEKGKSRVYSREVEKNAVELGESYDDDLTYNKVNLAEQAKRAQDYVREHLEEAKKIVDGVKHAPDNILDTAIRIAYEQEMLRIGNNDEYLRALKLHSGLQTLRGQEISAERISSRDVTNPSFWINKIIAARTEKVARKLFSNFLARAGIENPISAYKDMIKRETDNISKKVLAESTAEGQKKVLKRELERLRHEYDTGDGELLFQMPESKPYTSQNAKMYVREALDNLFGTTVTPEETSQIIAKVDDLTKSINNTLDETGNPSLQTWQQIRQINDLVESLTPSSNLRIATSIVGRGMMLASIKSPVLNIISNAENIVTEMLVRRAINKADGGAAYSAVDGMAIKDYLKYANDVYRTSGYNVSTTQDMDAMTVTLGEQRISSQGKGRFRAFSRGVETGVFKYLMGYPDSFSKDLVFSDTAAMEATTIAENEGLAGEALEKRATYLFKDATRVEPLSEEGRIIRDKAIEEANIATYTNDTALSKFALGMRQALNNLTGDVRLGDQLMPFVKTPANVVSLGLEYSAGLAYAIPNLPTIIKDVKAGKLSQTSRRAIKAAMRNGLGVVLAMLIAMAFDPDDYTPEYESLTPSERRLAMEKNAVFNSIRIGNRYISLDYFGPLAFPLTAVLMARKRDNSEWFGYIKGMSSQALKTPGIEELSDTVGSVKRTVVSGDVDKTVDNLINFFVDFIRARTIPSIVNDIAKMTDDYERETSGGRFDKAKNSIPVLREELPPKYMTLSKTPRETEPFWSVLAFGARFKTATRNRVLYEVDRLYKTGNRVTITDVTRSGKLSSLNEADQQRVRRDFAQKYYDAVYKIINSRAYRRMDDEQKAAELNKARRKIIEDLKDKYL